MKTKNTILVFSTLLFFGFSSCSNSKNKEEKEQTPQERLDGKWKIIHAEGAFAEINIGTLYIFEGTSKLTTKAGIIESKGTISEISETDFTVKFEGMQNDFNYKYHFENEFLIIEPLNSGQKFKLEKK